MLARGNTLELVCYPYLRKQLKTARKRGFLGSIFARIKTHPSIDSTMKHKLTEANLANTFIEFQQWQGMVSNFSLGLEKDANLFSHLDILMSPPANGRPLPLLSPAVPYDSKEYESLVVPEQEEHGQLVRLPALPPTISHNLLSYFSHNHQLPPNLKSANIIHFLLSGSAEYRWNNWDHAQGYSLQPGEVYDEHGGWRALDSVKLHDTIFFVHQDQLHAGLYVGGRMVIHKTSSDGVLWISTFREIFELVGRWSDVHVKPAFKAPKKFTAS